MAGQVPTIKSNDWLSEMEIEEIKREIDNPEIHGESSDEDDTLGTQND